jgi:glucose-1-phosphate adenylyltransferase
MKRRERPLGIVLAGGEGKRLMPLTADRAKPAVPFGGSYRLVDFVLSNLVNAEMRKIAVLTQYKSHSLDRHITTTWRMSTLTGNYITPVPAQQRLGPRWYTGSADAILQNFNLIHDENPNHVLVFGADHVYRMDPDQMFEAHIESGAGVTIAAIRMPRAEAHEFGVIELADDGITIKAFHEKPSDPPAMPGHPDLCLVSMGNYIFRRDVMEEALILDSEDLESRHDLGGNIIPMLTANGSAKVYDFANNVVPGETERDKGYWRDVGSIDAYYDAHMDLVSIHPIFNLYNREWPLLTNPPSLPPAKFSEGGIAQDSIVGAGSIISLAAM